MDQKSPDAFRTISEVAEWLDTPAHVLRFWESRFPQVKPVKRAGGRRYYRPSDMALLGGIKKLLHDDGMTIRGVQKILKAQGVRHVAAMSPALEEGALADFAPESEVVAPARPLRSTPAAEAPPRAAAPAAVSSPEPEAPPEPEALPEPETPEIEEPQEEPAEMARARLKMRDEREPEFLFETPAAETLPAAPEPVAAPATEPPTPAKPRPDLSRIADVPDNDSPRFDGPVGPFPLGDIRSVRARLEADPARAAALYARLVSLAGRMPAGRI